MPSPAPAPQIEFRSVAALKPYDKNARRHSRAQVRQTADSIRRFGFTNPVLISDDGAIVAGHSRVMAANELGMDWRHLREVSEAGEAAFAKLRNLYVWNKTNGGMGTSYRSKHELIFVFKIDTAPHTNSFGLGESGRYRTNVWDYPGFGNQGAQRSEALSMHPTVKPVALVADAIKDCLRRGEIVHDAFGGSGANLIAGIPGVVPVAPSSQRSAWDLPRAAR